MIVTEGDNYLQLAGQAWLVEEGREIAWAEPHVIKNPYHAYVLGKFVGTGTPNDNGHLFDITELKTAQSTVTYTPMNMLHSPHDIQGSFIASEIVYPTGEAGTTETEPYLEALGVYWKYYFPEEFKVIQAAHNKGLLAFSMECLPESVTCAASDGCGKTFTYAGRTNDTYCDHLNGETPLKKLNNPHFLAGALVVPPAKPAWKSAKVSELSTRFVENVYNEVAEEFPHLSPKEWEMVMSQLIKQTR